MIYSRVTNPTVQMLEERLDALEGAEAALAFGSGMGAICTLIWTLLRPGDELLVDATLYSCTHSLVHHLLPEFGIITKAADFTQPDQLHQHINSKTKLVLFETPANPNMRLVDIAAVSTIVRKHSNTVTSVDNTYCTPYLQRPLELGADVVTHSLTKYLNGHGDVLAGALMGTAQMMMTMRMDRHCASAQTIAEFLQSCAQVDVVYYPGLPSHPHYALAKRQRAQPGGMIAFELKGGVDAGKRFINALQLIRRAVSLGDAETLAQHPASMTHSPYTPQERAEHFISDGLVRLSVGLEDVPDLIADLNQALIASAA
jgi:methionine-gamma-lyase